MGIGYIINISGLETNKTNIIKLYTSANCWGAKILEILELLEASWSLLEASWNLLAGTWQEPSRT
jgi:hypothetical protein